MDLKYRSPNCCILCNRFLIFSAFWIVFVKTVCPAWESTGTKKSLSVFSGNTRFCKDIHTDRSSGERSSSSRLILPSFKAAWACFKRAFSRILFNAASDDWPYFTSCLARFNLSTMTFCSFKQGNTTGIPDNCSLVRLGIVTALARSISHGR